MSISNQLRERLDACRPGSGDLTLPELAAAAQALQHDPVAAEEFARSQQFDRQVAAALNDLPVPSGLADRLLATVPAAATDRQADAVIAPAQRTASNRLAGFTRRHWLMVGGSVALAVAAVAAIYPLLQPKRRINPDDLAADVAIWLTRLPESGWRAADGKSTGAVLAVTRAPVRWQRVTPSGWSSSVTAMDLTGAGQPRAVLFVVKSLATFSVPATPTPTFSLRLSGGLTATAWQPAGSNTLYVLVVEGPSQRLKDFLGNRSAA